MKVETPQILWNSEAEKGKNAPLLSIDMIESGIANHASSQCFSHVLVTAGNATCINLWKVSFGSMAPSPPSQQSSDANACAGSTILQKQTRPLNQIDYMMSLNRHERTVNTVAFSPNGLHLATAGDSGNIVLWSVPVHKRGNRNGRHFWSTLTKESELSVRIVSTHAEGIVDISWSADSKRFAVGTIDSCLMIYEDKHHAINACSPETHQRESEWQQVFRNAEHASFVQGVAYDPLGVYVASMGNDRTVRVFPRKAPPKSKKKVLRPANTGAGYAGKNGCWARTVTPPHEHQRLVANILTEAKVEMGKPKRIKQRLVTVEDATMPPFTTSPEQGQAAPQERQIKQRLFVDESNCESFFRRLSWTVDGAFLVTPAALWHASLDGQQDGDSSSSPSFSTYLFARHRFDEPYRVLAGLDKPSVVVRPNPVLFELPPLARDESKENQSPIKATRVDQSTNLSAGLDYRSIFAVLTLDSILIYDTHHALPLSVLHGLHYSGLTDCCWSQDGMNLMVCSSDGYISIVNFAPGELGQIYTPPISSFDSAVASHLTNELGPPIEVSPLPPCAEEDEEEAFMVIPAAKKAKKTKITPTLISSKPLGASVPMQGALVSSVRGSNPGTTPTTKRSISDTETESVGVAVTKLSLMGTEVTSAQTVATSNTNGDMPKKKKRVQPVLISKNTRD